MSIRIEHLDTKTAPEEVLRRFYDFWVTFEAAYVPDDPPPPVEWCVANWRTLPEQWRTEVWVGWEDDVVVAGSGAWLDLEQNLENADCWVHVHPDHRGNGYARPIATSLFDYLEENGRIRSNFRLPEGSEFDPLVKKSGAKPVLRMRWSRLLTSDIDRDLMDSWIDRAAERASDYDVIRMPSPIAEEYLERFAKAQEIMNDAPFEDFVHDDEQMSTKTWRDIEKSAAEMQDQMLASVAVHRETGEFVGFTNTQYRGLNPPQAQVWNTGIDPKHRNKGLGRWIKADMANWILDEYPEVERLDTFNAGSNEAMLNINVEMGFKPLLVVVNWQGETAGMRKNLGV